MLSNGSCIDVAVVMFSCIGKTPQHILPHDQITKYEEGPAIEYLLIQLFHAVMSFNQATNWHEHHDYLVTENLTPFRDANKLTQLRFLCYFNFCIVCTIIFQARSIALEAMATLSNVTDILSSLAVVGDEPLVMSVPQMSLVLQKIRSDVEGEHTVGNGQVSVHFPSVTEVLGGNTIGKNVDLQVSECNKLISLKNVVKIECIVSFYLSTSH